MEKIDLTLNKIFSNVDQQFDTVRRFHAKHLELKNCLKDDKREKSFAEMIIGREPSIIERNASSNQFVFREMVKYRTNLLTGREDGEEEYGEDCMCCGNPINILNSRHFLCERCDYRDDEFIKSF